MFAYARERFRVKTSGWQVADDYYNQWSTQDGLRCNSKRDACKRREPAKTWIQQHQVIRVAREMEGDLLGISGEEHARTVQHGLEQTERASFNVHFGNHQTDGVRHTERCLQREVQNRRDDEISPEFDVCLRSRSWLDGNESGEGYCLANQANQENSQEAISRRSSKDTKRRFTIAALLAIPSRNRAQALERGIETDGRTLPVNRRNLVRSSAGIQDRRGDPGCADKNRACNSYCEGRQSLSMAWCASDEDGCEPPLGRPFGTTGNPAHEGLRTPALCECSATTLGFTRAIKTVDNGPRRWRTWFINLRKIFAGKHDGSHGKDGKKCVKIERLNLANMLPKQVLYQAELRLDGSKLPLSAVIGCLQGCQKGCHLVCQNSDCQILPNPLQGAMTKEEKL